MTPDIPSRYRPVVRREEIFRLVGVVGAEIGAYAAEASAAGQDLLTVPVLRGAMYFFADVTRVLNHSVEVHPVRAAAYADGGPGSALDWVEVGPALDTVPASGRHVLVIDDICDSGRTLDAIRKRLFARGAASVKTAVFVRRFTPGSPVTPDFEAFVYDGPEWFVGYGMDDRGRYRNLPDLYVTDPAEEPSPG